MKSPKTLFITNDLREVQDYIPVLSNQHDVIIDNEYIDISTVKHIKEIDLLIMHEISSDKQIDLFQRLSSHLHIKSTFIVPSNYSMTYVLSGIDTLRTIFSENQTQKKSPPPTVPPILLQNQEQYSSPYLNGFMLGTFKVLINGLGVREWNGRKAKSILAYLLYNRKFANSREIIMDKFWPNVAPQAARNSLNGIIHKLRRVLKYMDPKHNYILYKEDRYLLNPDTEIELDYESFLSSFKTGQTFERNNSLEKAVQYYEEATRLYKGDFLQDNIYDEWTYSERESFKQKYLHALDRLSMYYLSQQKYLLAQQYCRKMLSKDDCLEAVHRRLMTCLYKNGYRDLAVKQFHKCAESLKKGLDIRPGAQTQELLNSIIYETQ